MYDYDYGYSTSSSLENVLEASEGAAVWTIVSFVLAIVGAILIYVLFLAPKKDYPNKFVNWLKEFLNFDRLTIEVILKVTYLFLAIFITLFSFALIGINFLSFLLVLILGNIMIRLTYEMSMVLVKICKNTTEINKKLKK